MTRSISLKRGKLWLAVHMHNTWDLHFQLRLRSGSNGSFKTATYFDISLLFFTLSIGYWSYL